MINKIISILSDDDNQLDAIALVPGSNFQYLTGGQFFLMERPLILIISKIYKPIVILPVLEVSNFINLKFDAEIIEWQDNSGTYDEHYHHHNVLLGTIDDLTWGQSLATNPSAGDVFQTDYAYKLPIGLTNDSIHFLSYLYDVDSYEILQVIKHEF